MPVEFIGMIGTKDESETRLTAGPVIDRDYVPRFARAHEDAGFDRVLIGYSSSQPDGTQGAAYAAAQTDRLRVLVAHRPGSWFRRWRGAPSRPSTRSPAGGSPCSSSPGGATASSAGTGTPCRR